MYQLNNNFFLNVKNIKNIENILNVLDLVVKLEPKDLSLVAC
jgi:hypothetical protein